MLHTPVYSFLPLFLFMWLPVCFHFSLLNLATHGKASWLKMITIINIHGGFTYHP